MVGVGFVLQPELAFLERLEGVYLDEADYFEVTPETLWTGADLRPNGFHRRFEALRARTGRPFVAHGVGLSLGSAGDAARRRRWLARVRADHATFDFRWYTEHLAMTAPDGLALALPLPVPPTAYAAALVRRRLAAMQRVVPDVGVENTATCFSWGDPLREPAFITRVLSRPGFHLLLDLHNLHTMATNLGFDPREWLAGVDLSRVIEIHVSGGSESPAAWLGGRSVRLDSHDHAVPEAVWALLASVLPRCTGLRGVTLERMEGTVEDADVPVLREELRRVRRMVAR